MRLLNDSNIGSTRIERLKIRAGSLLGKAPRLTLDFDVGDDRMFIVTTQVGITMRPPT